MALVGLEPDRLRAAAADLGKAACWREVAHLGVTVGVMHPSWIETDIVRGADADLPSFRRLRGRLPYPGNLTTSVKRAAGAVPALEHEVAALGRNDQPSQRTPSARSTRARCAPSTQPANSDTAGGHNRGHRTIAPLGAAAPGDTPT